MSVSTGKPFLRLTHVTYVGPKITKELRAWPGFAHLVSHDLLDTAGLRANSKRVLICEDPVVNRPRRQD